MLILFKSITKWNVEKNEELMELQSKWIHQTKVWLSWQGLDNGTSVKDRPIVVVRAALCQRMLRK